MGGMWRNSWNIVLKWGGYVSTIPLEGVVPLILKMKEGYLTPLPPDIRRYSSRKFSRGN
jgi:hypothetical protein